MASQKYNILYGRLSQEDERQRDDRQKESNSIHNQKLFLEQYAADHGFENTLFLADDGYSGTNFERPSWEKVIELIEADKVETLIVKDFSGFSLAFINGSPASSQPSYFEVSEAVLSGAWTYTYSCSMYLLPTSHWSAFLQEIGK